MKKIKLYKNFLTETLEINNNFIYEYEKIIVDVNSYGDLMTIVEYLEKLLNIEIRNIPYSDYYNNNRKYVAIISVKIIHHIIRDDLKTIYFSNILFLYSNSIYNELNDMIDFIEKTVDDKYFNKKHVLNISKLNSIKHLLTCGELTSFKTLYLNDKQKSYEGLKTRFIYPYQNIIIIIESAEDVIKIVEYIENEFNIIIDDVKPYLDNCVNGFGAMVLRTIFLYPILHNTITNNYSARDAFFILRHHNEDIVSYLDMRVSSFYFNREHVLDLKNINYIKDLILRGDKPTYKSLYTNKNKNIYESLIINRETYEYPFKRIMIMCESLNEYIESVKFIENILNIDIEDYTNQYIDKGIIALSVSKCYDIIDLNYDISEISSWDLFDSFKKRSIDNTNDEFLNYIAKQTSELFFNREDVIRNTSELYKIKKLLINGGVDTFKTIYLKNSEKSYESLLDKLEGPNEKEIKEYFKQNPGKGLIEAAKSNNLELIKEILDDKDIRYISFSDKRTAMWYACRNNFYSAVELLKSYNISIDLEVAAEYGYIDILKLGLDKKQNFLETKVLKRAVDGGQLESIKFLFENYKIDKIDNLIVIEHIIRLTNELPKNTYVGENTEYIPKRIEIFKYIINKFEYSLDKLEDLWGFAQDKGSYTISNYINDIIKERKRNDKEL